MSAYVLTTNMYIGVQVLGLYWLLIIDIIVFLLLFALNAVVIPGLKYSLYSVIT